jgi:hypothetical protein
MLDALSPDVNVILVIGNAKELVNVEAATGNGVFVADTSTDLKLTEGKKTLYAIYLGLKM